MIIELMFEGVSFFYFSFVENDLILFSFHFVPFYYTFVVST